MRDERERLSELYSQYLGSSTPPDTPNETEPSEPPVSTPVVQGDGATESVVYLDSKIGIVDGIKVQLTEEETGAIVKIVARAVARRTENDLRVWKQKYSLREKKR
jgi:hypothetical protein